MENSKNSLKLFKTSQVPNLERIPAKIIIFLRILGKIRYSLRKLKKKLNLVLLLI